MGRPKGSKNKAPTIRHTTPAIERFQEKYEVDVKGCWIWTGYIDTGTGYGKFYWNGKMGTAHDFSYEHFKGRIPDGLEPDHLCRNRACVNPSHLELVTRSENMKRGLLGGPRTHCKRGHLYSGDNLYIYPDGRRGCRACNNLVSKEPGRRWREKKRQQRLVERKVKIEHPGPGKPLPLLEMLKEKHA